MKYTQYRAGFPDIYDICYNKKSNIYERDAQKVNMNPLFFEILGIKIYYSNLFLLLGLFAMLAVSLAFARQMRLDKKYIYLFGCVALPLGLVLARAFYVIFNPQLFAGGANHPFSISEGGFSLFGAFLGAIAAAYAVGRKSGNFLRLTDCLAPGGALCICIARWGNYFNCECLGMEIENPNLHFFPLAVYSPVVEQWHFPVFFLESLICLGIFIFLLFASASFKRRGALTFFFFTLYCCTRTFMESMREDSMYIGFVRVSQLMSALVLTGLFIYTVVLSLRLGGSRALVYVVMLIFICALVRAFTAEFYMGANSRARNLVYLTVSLLIMGACTMFLYIRYYKLSKKPVKFTKRHIS